MFNPELILVVDDMPANLEVVCETLSDAGYEVITAIDGDRALKRVQSYPPDLILLDIQMPGIDGFETCKRLKANPATANIPIVFMTALADTESKIKGFELGAVDYITKPFQEKEVLVRVKTHLQLRQLTKNLEQRVAEKTIDLESTLKQLQQSHLQLIHSEKMSVLGNLVAAVAHEINNPLAFISSNLRPAREYIKNLLELLSLYQQELFHPSASLQQLVEDIDLEHIKNDLPKLLNSMQKGADLISDISISLRTFSRADSDRPVAFNLHHGLDSTILILKHRLKADNSHPEIQVIKNYGQIPLVECYAGQLNQVFINILANAIDALDESNQGRSFEDIQAQPNCITITTAVENDSVKVVIADNGKGMSDEVRHNVFDYLFTTKEVGKGTGLGLAIAKQIVEEKHGGHLSCNSELGQGTEFVIQIPLKTK